MLAGLLLVPAYAIAVAVSGAPDEGCPSPRLVADALASRLPGVALPIGQPAGPGALRLVVAAGPGNAVRVDLMDATGDPVLHRMLASPGRGRSTDCPALAETVALIVDRYLHEVGYEAPPLLLPPPPPPPSAPADVRATPAAPVRDPGAVWQLGIGAAARAGDVGGVDGAGMLAIGVHGRQLAARLAVGLAPVAYARWMDQRATLRRIPVRLALTLSLPAGPGRLEPGIGAGLDLLLASFNGPEGDGDQTRASPSAGATLGYALPLARHLYVRAAMMGGVGMPYKFASIAGTEVWSTARTYVEVGVESGVSFP